VRDYSLTSSPGWSVITGVAAASARIRGKTAAMSNALAYRRSPLGLFPGKPMPSPLDRVRKPVSGETLGIMRTGPSASDCGGSLRNGTEVVTWQAPAPAARSWGGVLGRPRRGSVRRRVKCEAP
jgi:hypothetical protein